MRVGTHFILAAAIAALDMFNPSDARAWSYSRHGYGYGEHARVFKHDRADRRFAAPVGELLVLLAGRAERVEGRGPARVGHRAAVKRREGPDPAAHLVHGLGERLGAEQLKGAGESLAERRGLERMFPS